MLGHVAWYGLDGGVGHTLCLACHATCSKKGLEFDVRGHLFLHGIPLKSRFQDLSVWYKLFFLAGHAIIFFTISQFVYIQLSAVDSQLTVEWARWRYVTGY